jgi:hypothetical protein
MQLDKLLILPSQQLGQQLVTVMNIQFVEYFSDMIFNGAGLYMQAFPDFLGGSTLSQQ